MMFILYIIYIFIFRCCADDLVLGVKRSATSDSFTRIGWLTCADYHAQSAFLGCKCNPGESFYSKNEMSPKCHKGGGSNLGKNLV